MSINEFLTASLDQIAAETKIDKTRWSRYLRGKPLCETTLRRAAKELGLSPSDLLIVIGIRREQNATLAKLGSGSVQAVL